MNRFSVLVNLFALLFLVTLCLVVAVQACMSEYHLKKKATLSLFKITLLEIKVAVSKCLSMTSLTKFYDVTQIENMDLVI